MMENYAELRFINAVQDFQAVEGTKQRYDAFYPHRTQHALSESDIAFIQTAAPIERVLTAQITAMDWNCPKYVPTLYSKDAIRHMIGGQIAQSETENEALRAEIARLSKP